MLADSTPAATRPLLLELARAHLLEQHWWDQATPPERWRIHDLLLLFVKERAAKKASQDGAGEAIMRFLYYWTETEFVHGIKAHIEVEGSRYATVEFREELGNLVVVPTDEANFEPPPGFEWDEEHGAWVLSEPNDAMRAAWEASEAQRWGDGHITDEGTTEGHDGSVR